MHKASLQFRAQLGYCWAQQDWAARAAALKKRLLLPLGKGAAADLHTQWEMDVGADLVISQSGNGFWLLGLADFWDLQRQWDTCLSGTAQSRLLCSGNCSSGKQQLSHLHSKSLLFSLSYNWVAAAACCCPSLPAVNSAGNALVVLRKGWSPRVLG